MRLLLVVLLIAALFIIGYYIFKTHARIDEHKLGHTVAWILKIGFMVILANVIKLLFPMKILNLVAYSGYYISAIWMLYFLLRFSIEFSNLRFEDYVKGKPMMVILALDTVSVGLNVFLGHLFDLTRTTWLGDEYYSLADTSPLFYVHYALMLFLAVICLTMLIYRAHTAPLFYRKKYLTISVIMIGVVILNILTYNFAVDFSVFGYVVAGVCIYYCVFVFTPQRLLPKTLFDVAHNIAVALFVYDADHKLLYKNHQATKLLDDDIVLMTENGITMQEWCLRQSESSDDFSKDVKFYRDKEQRIIKIQMQKIFDKKAHLQGVYFMMQDSTEELARLNKERFLAAHDSLTGLYNKEYFYEKTEQYINYHRDKEFLMICTDIREFKMINDFFGTKIGDQVLINFARMLHEQMQEASIYGRIANDIFGILIAKDKFDEKAFLHKAQEAFDLCIDTNIPFPTINYVGVYEIDDRSLPASVMCDRARMAINSIKGSFHNRVAYYNSTLRDSILHEQELITNLDYAIETGQIKMYLQPQMSKEGVMLGAEALVRWEHPEKGMIMPGDFIPAFEKNGLISEVDKHIWELACKQLRKWKDAGFSELYISVNISPRDFYFLNIYQVFTDLVKQYEIDPKNLKLEITESAVAMDVKRQIELIDRLREYGFIVEMDDFGSGYSSLNMLKDIHVDILKLDMVFLRESKDEERSKTILQMIINLSKQLGMPVISEGVETKEQVQYLAKSGCDMFQGYYFAKPMSVTAFENLYL